MVILYFSPIFWNDLKQRPQHIAEELSKYHKVFFIEPSISYIKSLLEGNDLYKYNEFRVNDNLKVIRPSGKFRLPKIFEVIDILRMNCIYDRIQMKRLLSICDIIWIGSPIYYSIFKGTKNKKIIYDKMDDYEYLTQNKILKKVIRKNEQNLVRDADIIFTSAQVFYDTIKKVNNNVCLLKNAVESSLYNNSSNNEVVNYINKLKKNNKTVFGYIGTIGNWFDYEAVSKIVNYNKNFHIVLVGFNKLEKISSPNLHYFGSVDKSKIPNIINSFDYCLYNFRINDFLNTIDPVKIYEYISLNKKVISVRSIETERFEGLVNLYDNYDELIKILDNIDSIDEPFHDENDLKNFIEQNSWDCRVKYINQKIKELYNGR